MAILSNINDKFRVDSAGAVYFGTSAGANLQVLQSIGTGGSPTWVDVDDIIGGPYLPLTGGTLTGNLAINGSNTLTVGGVTTLNAALSVGGRATFPSVIINRPQFPGGILAHDTDDANADIWGISRTYYPSHPTAANAWGLKWDATTNQFRFVGAGSDVVTIDLDAGNFVTTGSITGTTATFSGLVSGITPTANANFTTKAYVDGVTPGAGPFLKLDGTTTMTGVIGQVTSTSILGNFKGSNAAGYAEFNISNDLNNFIVIGSIGSTYSDADWAGSTYIYNTGSSRKMYIKSQDELRLLTGGTSLSSNTALTIDTSQNSTFTGLVSGITPTAAANFTTKAYVDAHPGSGGTVTSVATGNGLTGGTITSTGTLTMSGTYSGNFNFSTNNVVVGGNFTNNPYNSTSGARLMFGSGDSNSIANYYIGTNLEDFGGNYTKLSLAWHTGIKIGAQSQYGGVRFYDDEDFSNVILNIGVSNTNVGVVNDLTVGSNLTFTGQNLRSSVGLFLQVDSGNVNAITIDNVGSATFSGYTYFPNYLFHAGDTNTRIFFETGKITLRGDTNIILSGGNVGIGTTLPGNKLTVKDTNCTIDAQSTGDGQTIGLRAGYLNNADLAGYFRYTTGDAQLYIDNNYQGNNGVYSDINFRNKANGGTSLVNRIKIKGSTGNVGIGTESPRAVGSGYKGLEVSSPSAGSSLWLSGFSDTTNGYLAMDTGGLNLTAISNHSLTFGTNNSPKMTILSGGNVGIGTTSPGHKLEVNGGIRAGIAGNSSANTPALKVYAASASTDTTAAIAIQQGTSEGDTIIFADYEPHVEWGISAQNSTDQIHFTSGSSTNSLGSKTFYNNAGAARTAYIKFNHSLGDGRTLIGGNLGLGVTSATERLVVAGKVMINNVNAPNNLAQLNIGSTYGGETRAIDIDGNWNGGENKSITFTYGSAATDMVGQINCQHNGPGSRIRWGKLYHSGTSSTYTMELISSSQTTANLTVAGNITASADVVAYSDERLKSNIKTLDGSKVLKMRGVSFEKDGKKGSGVIAQELEKVAPELVNNDSEYKGVAYGNLVGYLIEAIKELEARVKELENK